MLVRIDSDHVTHDSRRRVAEQLMRGNRNLPRYSLDMPFRHRWMVLPLGACLLSSCLSGQSAKPSITLDEYLNTTDIPSARLSPDGTSAVIETAQPDWKNSVYRHDLWIWSAQSGLRSLTHSAGEEDEEWSPDGKWIA